MALRARDQDLAVRRGGRCGGARVGLAGRAVSGAPRAEAAAGGAGDPQQLAAAGSRLLPRVVAFRSVCAADPAAALCTRFRCQRPELPGAALCVGTARRAGRPGPPVLRISRGGSRRDARLPDRSLGLHAGAQEALAAASGGGGASGSGGGGASGSGGSGSGGSGGGGGGKKPPKPKNTPGYDEPPTGSLDKHTDVKTGKLSAEREALYDKIVAEVLKNASSVDQPEFHMMGGGPASGKSVALNSGKVNVSKNAITVDSDEIKKSIPEYQEMTKSKDPAAAAYAHDESSVIAKKVTDAAHKASMNVTLDGTGDSGYEKLAGKVAAARKTGAKVKATYVTVDTEVAVERNRIRAEKTGRLVPEAFVRNTHKVVSQIVPKAIAEGLFDEIQVFDTNKDGEVRLAASAKGKTLVIHDQELWDNFVAKGNE